MLSFDSSLENALETSSTESFWVLKLYYNAEGSSDFIGVSDKDRTDGSDIYYGIVASWGGLSQSLDFFNFTTSTLSMSINLINTDNTINGGRFSDLLSSNNFANRKWELFQNTSRHDTYDTSARMIGCGVISGNISYTDRALSLKLLDKTSKYNKQIPSSVVDIATYPNAPEKNINKPIPIAYGDFYQKTNIGTIPTSFFDRYKQFYKSAYPAIITDQWDVGVEASEAKADSQALHTLDSENIYFYKQGYYPTLTGTIGISSNPTITLAGSSASVYVPLSSSGQGSGTVNGSGSVSNPSNAVDGDFQSKSSMVANGSTSANSDSAISYAIPKVPKLGQYSDINIITKYGTSTNLANEVDDYFEIGNVAVLSITSDSETEVGIPGIFTSDKRDAFNFEGNVTYKLYSDAENETVEIYETGAKVDFNIEGIESHQISEQYEETVTGGFSIQTQFEKEEEVITETIVRTRTKNIETPSEIDYIYYSGKGRKYHSDIASRTSYNTTDFYENPVYIIEDIIRQELSLGDSEIDETLFDASSGHLGDIFNDSLSDIKFAFSQNKFINSKDLINRISKQILSWVFISGDGKFKIRTLRRTGDYSSADRTIDFEDIFFNSVSKTSLNGVRNDIVINYNYDYGQNQFIASVNPTADSTSTGTTVNGYNQTLTLKMDADIIDETTATKLAEAYREIFKDRKVVINFECLRAKYNDLEIGDIIKFSNWDSSIKIYGDAMGTDYYIISNITKTPNTSSIKAIKVS
jgi:hypothetical protein